MEIHINVLLSLWPIITGSGEVWKRKLTCHLLAKIWSKWYTKFQNCHNIGGKQRKWLLPIRLLFYTHLEPKMNMRKQSLHFTTAIFIRRNCWSDHMYTVSRYSFRTNGHTKTIGREINKLARSLLISQGPV